MYKIYLFDYPWNIKEKNMHFYANMHACQHTVRGGCFMHIKYTKCICKICTCKNIHKKYTKYINIIQDVLSFSDQIV